MADSGTRGGEGERLARDSLRRRVTRDPKMSGRNTVQKNRVSHSVPIYTVGLVYGPPCIVVLCIVVLCIVASTIMQDAWHHVCCVWM